MVTFGYQRYLVLHDSMLCTWSMVTSVTWWLPAVTMCYQRYQVLHDSMLCMLCIVTSVTWWVPVVTFGYRRYLVLQDPRLYTWSTGQHCYPILETSGNKRAGLKNLCTVDMPIGVLIPPERQSCGYNYDKQRTTHHIVVWH